MAKSHPGLKLLTNYLRNDFPWKKNYKCETNEMDIEFSYPQVKEALRKLKITDPKLHRLLSYRYMTNRSRSAIAQSLYMDSSTLKRSWDKAMFILQNWLVHGTSGIIDKKDENPQPEQEALLEELSPIDLMYKED